MGVTFEIKEDFYLDGQPFKIISGAIHYFRVVPEYWEHRLTLLKNMGCNTVETYVPWNLHEPREGEFDFEGIKDIRGFIQTADKLGLKVIIRPSAYICAEWEFGGLPSWLLKDPQMRVRSNYPGFLEKISRYHEELFKQFVDLQINHGGPIILMQVENEYGGYANDKEYLRYVAADMRTNGVVVPLVTSDGPWHDMLENGSIQDIALPTMNCGSKINEHFDKLAAFHGEKKPLMVMEYWVGWFDAWGDEGHHTTDIEEATQYLDDILKRGSVNIYMFHGGTNFGFMNGSNYYGKLLPDTTSYDYDALINEHGEVTEKYLAFKNVISQYVEIEELPVEQPKRLGEKILTKTDSLSLKAALPVIGKTIETTYPLGLEAMDQSFGYVYYESSIGKAREIEDFRLIGTADRATVLVNDQIKCQRYDLELPEKAKLILNDEENQLGVLVENMGRVNYSVTMDSQRKGINGGVVINGAFHTNWTNYSLDFSKLSDLSFTTEESSNQPSFNRFKFDLSEVGDTFVDISGWGKGVVFINGHNLGRFWEVGPQTKLYLPAPFLRVGENEMIVFETEGKVKDVLILSNQPEIQNGLTNKC